MEYKVMISRYAPDIGNIARRGMTAEDYQYIKNSFLKDKPAVFEKLHKVCSASDYKLKFEIGFSLKGAVLDVFAVFDSPIIPETIKTKDIKFF